MGFKREPAAWAAIIQAGLALLIGFGIHITPAQAGLIMAFVSVVLGVVVRANVYAPVNSVGQPISVTPPPSKAV